MRQRSTLAEMVTLAAFCAFLLFFGLGAFGLVGADEPRYAQIAREMLARVRPLVQGVQVSAPFGRVEVALDVLR
jgi:4-amino-4-deoxy-L-arabinose transferase-like glycosyltransferase